MSYWREFYVSLRVQGFLIGLIGTIITWASWGWSASEDVSLKWIFAASAIVTVVVATSVDAGIRLTRKYGTAARVRTALKSPQANTVILLLEPTGIFHFNSIVTIFTLDDDVEVPIGIGYVHNIQGNGLVQVLAYPSADEAVAECWKKISERKKDVLKLLLVKPSLPRELAPGVIS